MDERLDRWVSLGTGLLALVALCWAGVDGISAHSDDMVTVFGLFSVDGQWQIPLSAVLLAIVSAAVALRRPRWSWGVAGFGVVGAVVILATMSSLTADAVEINDWIATEGTASIDSPVSRAIGGASGPLTRVDTDVFSQAMVGAGILLGLSALNAARSLWAFRRAQGSSGAATPAVV